MTEKPSINTAGGAPGASELAARQQPVNGPDLRFSGRRRAAASAAPALDRRAFLQLGLAGGTASLAAACGWDGGNAIRPKLMSWSRVNDWVGEKILYSPRRLAHEYAASERSSQMPAYMISNTVPMLADPKAWRLRVDGLVQQPLSLSLDDLQRLPRVTYTVKHHCVEGWSAIATWHGVPVSTIAAMCRPTAAARYLDFHSFDADYSNGWDIASAMHPQTLLAYAWNDQPLAPSRGAPLRLYSPTKLGYKMTKWLTAITFTDKRPGGYWEDQGYPWFAGL